MESTRLSYDKSLAASKRLEQALLDPPVMRPIRSPFHAALLEANGGCVVGGNRDKEGNLIIEPVKQKSLKK